MLGVEEKEQIRRAVLVEGKSQRQVARETGHSRNTIRKMLEDGKAPRYRQKRPRRTPVLGAVTEADFGVSVLVGPGPLILLGRSRY
jgi:transposase-like protein